MADEKQVWLIDMGDGNTIKVRARTEDRAKAAALKYFQEGKHLDRISKARSFGLGALDMGSMGFSDEIGAALRSGAFFSGADYDRELARNRKALENARAANPVTYMGGQAVGAIAPALVSGGVMGGANTIRGLTALGAKTGAVEGALYGFGSGQDGLGNRLQSAAAEGATGAVIGAGLGAAGGAGLKALGKVAPSSKAVNVSNADRMAARQVNRMIRQSGLSPEEAIDQISSTNPLAMQNKAMRSKAQGYSIANEGARDQMFDAANRNYQLNLDDTMSDYRTSLDGAPNGFEYMKRLQAQQKANARRNYGQAASDTNALTPGDGPRQEALRFLDEVNGVEAAHKSRRKSIDAFEPLRTEPELGPDGKVVGRRFVNNPTYDDFESLAATARKMGQKRKDGVIGDYGKNISRAVDAEVPNFQQPRADFAMEQKIQDAFNMGNDAFLDSGKPKNTNEFLYEFNKLSDVEKDAVRQGLYSRIEDSVFGNPSSPDPIMRNIMKSTYGERVMRAVLGDGPADNIIAKSAQLDDAIQLRSNLNTDRYNSARSMVDQKSERIDPTDAVQTAADAYGGNWWNIGSKALGFVSRRLQRKVTQEEIDATVRLLFETDPDMARNMLRRAAEADAIAVDELAALVERVSTGAARGAYRSIDFAGGGGF